MLTPRTIEGRPTRQQQHLRAVPYATPLRCRQPRHTMPPRSRCTSDSSSWLLASTASAASGNTPSVKHRRTSFAASSIPRTFYSLNTWHGSLIATRAKHSNKDKHGLQVVSFYRCHVQGPRPTDMTEGQVRGMREGGTQEHRNEAAWAGVL